MLHQQQKIEVLSKSKKSGEQRSKQELPINQSRYEKGPVRVSSLYA